MKESLLAIPGIVGSVQQYSTVRTKKKQKEQAEKRVRFAAAAPPPAPAAVSL